MVEKKKARAKHRGIRGAGSVYRRDDGRWVGSFIVEETGKRKYLYGKTQQEAYEKLQNALQDQKQGMLATGAKEKVGDYLTRWLDVHKVTLRISTYKRYQVVLDKNLIPALGHLSLQKLAAQHIQTFYAKLVKEGISPRTIKMVHAVLRKALNQAVRWKLIPRNVCADVSIPRYSKHNIHPLTMAQAKRLMEVSKGSQLEVFITLALMTGMRRGELLALRWAHVDFATGCLNIHRNVAYVTGYGYVEDDPKTSSGNRAIPLPQLVIDLLKQHRSKQLEVRLKAGSKWQDNDLVFSNKHGNYFSLTVMYKVFNQVLIEAEIPHMRFHDLRHSAATILLALGIHPKVVQERLGHSQISMTMDTYSHVLPSMQQEATDKLDILFREQEREQE
ncbi:site-specific integrase [Dictyobacter arantiisoli]|uniref:Site-specific integrase n=1 Tax=Dictyobacter arantiisoli TaxID=2014874 RepID=A0A5A5T7X0_9CHLR|nr:tyrosine-type recombinase/integrase [Dictyobacter arantiisoli]GCF07355.1 site-specific integrase [Dictyobacter arantiisoli]